MYIYIYINVYIYMIYYVGIKLVHTILLHVNVGLLFISYFLYSMQVFNMENIYV